MAPTNWTNEVVPGGSVVYDDSRIAYDRTEVFEEAGTPRYDTIGVTTEWTNESQ